MMSESRLMRDQQIATLIITMYCRETHGPGDEMCSDCQALNQYAHARLAKCPHGDAKPMCHECTIHCYKPDMRAQITEVMRIIGPKMRNTHTRPSNAPAKGMVSPVASSLR